MGGEDGGDDGACCSSCCCCGGRGAASLVTDVDVFTDDDDEEGPTPISTPSTGIPNRSTIDTFNTVSIPGDEDDDEEVDGFVAALLLLRLAALMYLSFRSEKVSILPERDTSSVT